MNINERIHQFKKGAIMRVETGINLVWVQTDCKDYLQTRKDVIGRIKLKPLADSSFNMLRVNKRIKQLH